MMKSYPAQQISLMPVLFLKFVSLEIFVSIIIYTKFAISNSLCLVSAGVISHRHSFRNLRGIIYIEFLDFIL